MINKNTHTIKPEKTTPRDSRGILPRVLSIVLLIWVGIIVILFYRMHSGLFQVFSVLFNRWHVWWGSCPVVDILSGCLMLGLYFIVGYLVIRSFDMWLPVAAELCLAFVAGVSIMTIPFELLAIVGWLYQPVVCGVFAVAIAIAGYYAWRRKYSTMRPESGEQGHSHLFIRGYRYFVRKEYAARVVYPTTPAGKAIYGIALSMTGIIVVLSFFHAVFYAETYWDSLIYYLGYGRMTFLAHQFPVKVVAQVGLGLGANYPHLYPLLGATLSTLAGKWSSVYPQLVPPIAGLLSTIFIYLIVVRLTRIGLIAALAALLFRSIPDVNAYFMFASDYALTMLFTAAFLYLALCYVQTRRLPHLILAMLVCAGSVHVNYLMWYLWFGWGLLVLLVHVSPVREQPPSLFCPGDLPLTKNYHPPRLGTLLASRKFLLFFIIAVAMSSTWYIRNIIVTGNPVYAFYPEIFDGKNINSEVLESCFVEWRLNGDGIGKFGDTVVEKIRNSWKFFVTWEHSWKFAPVFMAFGISGFILGLLHVLKIFTVLPRRKPATMNRFLVIVLYVFAFMLFYEYCISDIYLYQIVPLLVAVGVLCSLVLKMLWGRGIKVVAVGLCLIIGIVPGIAMSLMGFKVPSIDVIALRNPCMPDKYFRRLRFGGDVKMWDYVNAHLKQEKILTHENRHLVYDPSITFVHLDDIEIQALYELNVQEKLQRLNEMGIDYYLYIPMERHHPILERLGIHNWTGDSSIMKKIYQSPVTDESTTMTANILYRFVQHPE